MFPEHLIKVGTSHQVCDKAPMGCCVKTGSGSSCSDTGVQSSFPQSDGHTRGSSTGCPPSSLRSLHTMSISGTMQERRHEKTDTCGTLTRYEGGHEALRHGGSAEAFTLQSRHTASINLWCSRSLTCADPLLCRFLLWRSLCRETFFDGRGQGVPRRSVEMLRIKLLWVIQFPPFHQCSTFGDCRSGSPCAQLAPALFCPFLGFPVRHTADWDVERTMVSLIVGGLRRFAKWVAPDF